MDRYAITCDAIAYHLVHFVSIYVIYKCQSGIDFFILASAQYNSNLMNKISVPVKYFSRKRNFAKWMRATNINKAMRFTSGTIKIR